MQVPILSGIYTDNLGNFRSSYPVNMIPVPKQSGVSAGFLRPAEGLKWAADVTGLCRGGVSWEGDVYYVVGQFLHRISGDTITTIGEVKNDLLPVSFAFSFDRLAIASGKNLYYLSGGVLSQVTDPDIGDVLDVKWVDGYFVTTDGEFIVVTELNDPASVNLLKYGSSEVDPDSINQLLISRNEIYSIGRYSIEVFTNVGGDFFPFARINGAHIPKGSIGRNAACVYNDAIAFLGSGRNEPPGIYLGENAQTVKISTHDIDNLLASYSDDELSTVYVETRTSGSHKFLYIHLPDRAIVYDSASTLALQEPVWFVLTSSLTGFSTYRARYFVWGNGKWYFGDPSNSPTSRGFGQLAIGCLDETVGSHYGTPVRWEFGTSIVWAETGGAIFHEIELVALGGRAAFGENPVITTSHTNDGSSWSPDAPIKAGTFGDRLKRLIWRRQGLMQHMRAQRFRGTSDALISPTRLEIRMEPLIR